MVSTNLFRLIFTLMIRLISCNWLRNLKSTNFIPSWLKLVKTLRKLLKMNNSKNKGKSSTPKSLSVTKTRSNISLLENLSWLFWSLLANCTSWSQCWTRVEEVTCQFESIIDFISILVINFLNLFFICSLFKCFKYWKQLKSKVNELNDLSRKAFGSTNRALWIEF